MKQTKQKAKAPKYNNYACPKGMSLEEWQRALRRQQAEKEILAIDSKGDGEFVVRNAATRMEYKVVYRGTASPWNYCSCMDFKTSGLGTCKHLEAVKMNSHCRPGAVPAYTSVYLDYHDGRQVRIRIGPDNKAEFTALAAKYFRKDGVLKLSSYDVIDRFLAEALHINDSFRCYQDALDYIIEQRERKKRIALINSKYDDVRLDSLLATSLYPYQREGIRFAAKAGKAIIADEMGLGKTVQAIGVAELLRSEGLVSNVLVLAPTSLKYQWKREIERFVPGVQVMVVEGLHTRRREMYRGDATYKIVSYNSACNDIKVLGGLSCDLLIMDEVQRLKNWNTQISRAARRIESDYSVILSGTPLENKLEELYSIVEFADQYALAPYYKFRDDCILTDATGKVLGYKNLNAVGKKLENILIRRRKRDVNLQLPQRLDQNIFVPMTKEQMEIHEEFQATVAQLVFKWQKMHFLSETDRRRLLLCLSQMRMVCDSTYILDQKTRFDTKVDEAMNIIGNLLEESDDNKIVVFSGWERMTRLVAAELDARGIRYEYLHGGVPSEKRKDLVSNFTDLPENRVFLSTDAGSTGLNLQAANTIINLDLPWNPAVLEQRIARIHRIGQQRSIQVINLVSAQTIEERMIGKLKFKTSLFEGVLDGGEDTVFASDDKFTKIMDLVGEVVEPSEQSGEKTAEVIKSGDAEPRKETPSAVSAPVADEPSESEGDSQESSHNVGQDHARDVVSQGVTFLSSLMDTLKSPEKTAALVDSIVVEDKESGKASLNIPIPDKKLVSDALAVIAKLISK